MKLFFYCFLILSLPSMSLNNSATNLFIKDPNHLQGYDNCNMYNNGEQMVIKQFIKNNDVVFDVGANKGEWSSTVIAEYPAVTLYCFEPIPYLNQQLNKTLPKNCHILGCALSNKNDHILFYVNTTITELSSFHYRPHFDEQKHHIVPITIPTYQLDTWISEHHIPHINFMKIDTEGHELAVIQGAQLMLTNQAIDLLQFEYGGTYQDAGITLKQIFDELISHNYHLFRISSNGLIACSKWQDCLENNRYCNYLAISSSYLKTLKTEIA